MIPDYRLPEHIERGSGFGPAFRNVIHESIAGTEQRLAQWMKCRGTGDVSYGLQDSSDQEGDFKLIVAMFRAHCGSMLPFRFRDWSDYIALDEVFGTGDGTTTVFQLTKTYDPSYIKLGVPGSLLYVRAIMLPSTTPVIEINGAPTTAWTISESGMVTFTAAPAAAAQLSWSGEFDVPVRFDTDTLQVVLNENDIASIRSLPIKEVIGVKEVIGE